MTIEKFGLSICGLILLVLAIAAFQFPELLPAVQLAKVERVDGSAEITSGYAARTASGGGTTIVGGTNVEIRYPRRIAKNETLNVVAKVSQFSVSGKFGSLSPPVRSTTKQLAWPIRLTLRGAAFDIDPTERSFQEGAALPLIASWTALPKITGDHMLLLDWSDTAPASSFWATEPFHTKVLVNDSQVSGDSNIISLPTEVVTKWGITQFWADVLAGLITFIGFLLSLPIFGWLWKRFTASNTSAS